MRKDDVTQELPGVPKRRGRPASAATPRTESERKAADAKRKAEQRKRLAEGGRVVWSGAVGVDVVEALRKHVQFKDEDQASAVDRILRAYLLRKR